MKKSKKVVLGILIGLLSLIVLTAVILNIYLPRYWSRADIFSAASIERNPDEFVVMSYNVRCWTVLDLGKKSWPYRADLVMDTVAANAPDIIGFQEATTGQYDYLLDTLAGYNSVIQYRDNSLFKEGCPVFYNALRFTLVEQGSFWLSETPDEMSKDWGAANYRICTYVVLTDKNSGKQFTVFNTHLDHVSDEARINGIRVILDKMDELGGFPAVLMGDLNAEESSETYRMATENLIDAKYMAAESATGNTYQNWGAEQAASPIDYILLSPGDFQVEQYSIDTRTYDGVYPSDHFPLCVKLRFAAS